MNVIIKTTNRFNDNIWKPIAEFDSNYNKYVGSNIQKQLIVKNRFFLVFFYKLLFRHPEDDVFKINSLKTEAIIPYPSQVDIVFRKLKSDYYFGCVII